jgi:SAM-dependent methyltransferase
MFKISSTKRLLKKIRSIIYGILHAGVERKCPLCGKRYSRFGKGGVEKRDDAQCLNCGSLERHRFLWLYLERKMGLNEKNNLSVLHFAPEKYLEKRLRGVSGSYITADIEGDDIDIKVDITSTPFEKDTFDLILCSHVLEHVHDDRKALKELLRILTPAGTALIIIPIERERTFEDPTITKPADRLRIFGQEDHVRIYGVDFIDRLAEAGFDVKSYLPKDLFNEAEQIKYGIKNESDWLYVCGKKNSL